jgi:hypothetical protein
MHAYLCHLSGKNMKARINIQPKVLPLRKDFLPRKRPFRIAGNLTVEELNASVSQKKDRSTAEQVVSTVGDMKGRFVELAKLLKEIQVASEQIKGLAVDEVIEV